MAPDGTMTSSALGNVANLPTDSDKTSYKGANAGKPVETPASLSRYLDQYSLWLERTCPSPHTRRIYLSRVKQFLRVISDPNLFPLSGLDIHEPNTWTVAINAYKLSVQQEVKPSTINAALNGIQNFVRFLKLGNAVRMQHVCLPYQLKTLTIADQQRFITALRQSENAKHRAIGMLLFSTGIKVGQLTALDLHDISLKEDRGTLFLKQDGNLEIALSQPVVQALREWLGERKQLAKNDRALFLNQRGKRLATSTIDPLIRKMGTQARLYVSPQVLRHTFLEKQSTIDAVSRNKQ